MMTQRSASPFAGHSRAPQRIAVALLAINEVDFLISQRAVALVSQPEWSSPWLYRVIADSPGAIAALAGIAWTGLALLALGRNALLGAGVALVAMHLIAESMFGTMATLPPRSSLVGLLLAGWFVGLALARRNSGPNVGRDGRLANAYTAEALAEQLAVAAFASGYVCAGLAKVVRSGIDWDHRVIWHLIACSQPVDGFTGVSAFDGMLAGSVLMAMMASATTLMAQFGAALMPFGAQMRVVFGLFIGGVHFMMWAAGGVYVYTTTVFALVFCVPWRGLGGFAKVRSFATVQVRVMAGLERDLRWVLAVGLVVLTLAAALGADRFFATRPTYPLHIWQPWPSPVTRSPRRSPLSPANRSMLSPLVEGATLHAEGDAGSAGFAAGFAGARSWVVDALEDYDDGSTLVRWRRVGAVNSALQVVEVGRADPFTGARAVRWLADSKSASETLLDDHAADDAPLRYVAALVAKAPLLRAFVWPPAPG